MNQRIMDTIMQNHHFHQFQISKEDHKIEMENHHYMISIIFYHQAIVEEIIYDKHQQEICFYFHHEHIYDTQTIAYIEEFLDIAYDITSNFLDLKDYKSLNDSPCYLQNLF